MSIETRKDITYIPCCDFCNATLPPEYDYDSAVDAMTCEGWSEEKINGEPRDLCPKCQLCGVNNE